MSEAGGLAAAARRRSARSRSAPRRCRSSRCSRTGLPGPQPPRAPPCRAAAAPSGDERRASRRSRRRRRERSSSAVRPAPTCSRSASSPGRKRRRCRRRSRRPGPGRRGARRLVRRRRKIAVGSPCGPGCYRATAPAARRAEERRRHASRGDEPDDVARPAAGAVAAARRLASIVARATKTFRSPELARDPRPPRLRTRPHAVVTRWSVVAPDKLTYKIVSGGPSAVIIGNTRWDKVPGGTWEKSPQTPIHQPTPFWVVVEGRARALADAEGRWRVSFFDPKTPGLVRAADRQRHTHAAARHADAAAAHFMRQVYSELQRAGRRSRRRARRKKRSTAVAAASSRIRLPLEMSRARASWLVLVALAGAAALVVCGCRLRAPGRRRLARLGQHARQHAPLAADADHQGQHRPARTHLHVQLPLGRPERAARQAVVPGRRRQPDVRHDRRAQTWALDATTGKVIWRWTPNNVAVFNKAASSPTAASRSATARCSC